METENNKLFVVCQDLHQENCCLPMKDFCRKEGASRDGTYKLCMNLYLYLSSAMYAAAFGTRNNSSRYDKIVFNNDKYPGKYYHEVVIRLPPAEPPAIYLSVSFYSTHPRKKNLHWDGRNCALLVSHRGQYYYLIWELQH